MTASPRRRRAPWVVLGAVVVASRWRRAFSFWQAERPDQPSIDGRVVGPPANRADATVRTRRACLPARRAAGLPPRRGSGPGDRQGRRLDLAQQGRGTRGDQLWSGWRRGFRAPSRSRSGAMSLFGRPTSTPVRTAAKRGMLDPDDGPGAYRSLLAGVAPVLADADITAVNLETPVVDDPTTTRGGPGRRRSIPSKEFAFASAPPPRLCSRTPASMSSTWETTTCSTGCRRAWETRGNLTAAGSCAGSGSFGAGLDADRAWAPAIREVHGQRVAFLGCTSFQGGPGHQQCGDLGRGGAARCSPARLRGPSQTFLDEPTSWW